MSTGARICYLCGNSYHYCPNCDKDKEKPKWLFTFCSDNCHSIFETLTHQTVGHLSNDEAKETLDHLNIEREKYDGTIQAHLDRIYDSYSKSHNKSASKGKRNAIKPTVQHAESNIKIE